MSPISEHGEFFHPPFPGVPGSHHFPGQSHIPGGPGYWQGGHFPGAAQQAWDPGQYNHQVGQCGFFAYNYSLSYIIFAETYLNRKMNKNNVTVKNFAGIV